MNPDDLLKLLDLRGTEKGPVEGSVTITANDSARRDEAASPTALAIDEWGLRRGRDLVQESERLKKLDVGDHAAADFFTAAFDPDPQLQPACSDQCRNEFVSQLLETPEYRELHSATRLDDTAAGIAAAAFAEQFAELKKSEEKERPDGSASGDGMETLRAVGRALATAREEVGELKEAAAALGMGAGAPGSNDARAIAELFKKVRSDATLKRICALAGRYRRVAQSKQRRKQTHGLDDVVGVEPGGDLSRLLPHELARLGVPEFELDTLRRLVERETLCREHHAVERVGKGPIIVSVDESGSMHGEKVETAKALALALAWIARQQRRWCALIAYSGDSGERLLPLPTGRWDEMQLADWLSDFIGQGSDLDVPLRELPRMAAALKAPVGETDVILITDAVCRVPDRVREKFCEWKTSTRVRVIALVVDSEPGNLTAVCDEVHVVNSLSTEEEAVGRVLSI